jgi:hypothetical protein
MTQKELVLEILQELRTHREIAEGMIALIEAGFMDKDTYTNLLFMISGAIKSLPEGEQKTALKQQLELLREGEKVEKKNV